MSNKEIISTNQNIWMLFIIVTSFTILEIPAMLIFQVGRDAWLSVIIAWFLDILLAIVYAYMGIRFPNQTFVQYSITILGKYLGKAIGIIFPFFFIMVASSLMRSISMLIDILVLPNTPIIVILLTGHLIIAYAVKKGIEVIARACEVLSPIFLMSFILLFIILMPLVKIERLKPQLADGFYPVISGSFFILTFIGVCIMMAMYIPICNRPDNGFKAKFIAVSLGASVISILVSIIIGVFGAEQAGNMVNPGLRIIRMISVSDTSIRLDVIWLIIAISAAIITSANLIWASSVGISQVFELKTHQPIIYPITLLSFVFSIISFDSNMEFMNFAFYVYPFIGFFVETCLEMFLFFMALILKKRG